MVRGGARCFEHRPRPAYSTNRISAAPAPTPPVNRYTGPPATLGSTAAAGARLIVWCRDCRHQVEPDPAAMAERYGAEMTIPDWHKRLVCGQCGSRKIDFVITGAKP
jgi:hypothetical protein